MHWARAGPRVGATTALGQQTNRQSADCADAAIAIARNHRWPEVVMEADLKPPEVELVKGSMDQEGGG